MRDRGVVTIPRELRERYGFASGDVFWVMDLDGVLVLSPRAPVLPRAVGAITREREAAGVAVEDLIRSADEERHGGPDAAP